MNRFRPRALALIAAAVIHIIGAVLLVAVFERGLRAMLIATLFSYGVAVVVLYAGLPRPHLPRLGWREYRESVAFSWPLYGNNLLAFITQRFDAILIGAFLGPGSFAIYEMAKRLPAIVTRFLSAALVPYLPGVSNRIAQGDLEGAARLMQRAISLVTFLGYSGVLAVLTVQTPLVRLMFDEEYLPMTVVLWALLTGSCLAVQTGIVGQSILAMGRPLAITVLGAGSAAVSIAANTLLIPPFGMVGAGWGFLSAVGFGAVSQTAYLRYLGFGVPILSLLKPQCFLAIALAIFWQGGMAIWAGVLGLLVFMVLCFVTSVVTVKEFQELARALLQRKRPAA